MELVKNIIEMLGQINPISLIIIIFIVSFIENIFPPISGDTMLVFTAYLFGKFAYSLTSLFIFSFLGSVIGFMFVFAIGHHWGREFFLKNDHKWMPINFLHIIEKQFNKYGLWAIFWNRLFLGMRAAIGIFSGISNIKWWITLIFISISTAIYNFLLMMMGYYLGDNWEKVQVILKEYNIVTGIILFVLLAVWFFRRERFIENYKGKK